MFWQNKEKVSVCAHCKDQINDASVDYRTMPSEKVFESVVAKTSKADAWAQKYGLWLALSVFPIVMLVGLFPHLALIIITGMLSLFIGFVFVLCIGWIISVGVYRIGAKVFDLFGWKSPSGFEPITWLVGCFSLASIPLAYVIGTSILPFIK